MNKDYIKSVKSGLVDTNGVIKLEFIKNSQYPQLLASEMSTCTPKLSSKQARSFYNAVNKIYLDILSGVLSMEEAIVELTMLSSRVNDKFNKGYVPAAFKEFIDANVDAISDVHTMKAFVLHFEAVCNNLKDSGSAHNNGVSVGHKSNQHKTNGNVKYDNGGQKRW